MGGKLRGWGMSGRRGVLSYNIVRIWSKDLCRSTAAANGQYSHWERCKEQGFEARLYGILEGVWLWRTQIEWVLGWVRQYLSKGGIWLSSFEECTIQVIDSIFVRPYAALCWPYLR